MQIVVVGYGKMGQILTEQLSREGHSVTVIDDKDARLTNAQNEFDVMCVCGNGASREVQVSAGVPDADLLIATTGVDELNLLCCLIAKKLGAKKTIARVRNPEYADELSLIRDDLGLSMTLNPELSTAHEIFSVLRFPGLLTVEKFAGGKLELAEFRVSAGNPLAGVALRDLGKRFHVRVLICAVRRGESVTIPNGDFVIAEGDYLSFMTEPVETLRFLAAANVPVRPPKKTIIVGAGRVAYYLTRLLKSGGILPVVIEQDPERSKAFSEAFPDCLVLCGDGTDRDLLQEEGLFSADAFVAATGTDEVNILLALYAAKSVPKVVTKVSRMSMVDLTGEESVGSVVSPKEISASRVVSYVRALENSGASNNVESLYRIVGGSVEALEFVVRENDGSLIGIPLRDLPLKKELLVCCIIRNGKVLIPRGSDHIEMGDHVIVATTTEHLTDLHNILA